jgi:hypothetical protein
VEEEPKGALLADFGLPPAREAAVSGGTRPVRLSSGIAARELRAPGLRWLGGWPSVLLARVEFLTRARGPVTLYPSVKTNWREGGALPGRGRSGKGQEKVKIKSHQGSTSCFAGQGPYQRTAATRSNEQAQGGNSTPVLLTHASIRA